MEGELEVVLETVCVLKEVSVEVLERTWSITKFQYRSPEVGAVL